MPTAASIAQTIKAALALTEPDLDTSIGSVVGKITDAIAIPMAEAFLDQHLTAYQYDIDSKSGGDLEGFVRLFGMDRRAARFAVGTVTFGRTATTAALGVAAIPMGTQVMSMTNPVAYVQTSVAAILAVGQTTIDVPVQSIVPGAAGNLAAATLTQLASDVSGLSTATTNVSSMTRGRDAESDTDLRERWKATVFRNMAGTLQMYRAMAIQADDSVTVANVIGPKKTWNDRITIAAGTSGVMSFGNPQFIYAAGVFLGPDIGASVLLSQGTDYTVSINNTVIPATVTVTAVSGGGLVDGDYDIQYDYVATYSRNNPFGTRFNETAFVNNRIDIWVNGLNPSTASQACKFSTLSRFTNVATDPLYIGKYRTLDGTAPLANDIFTPLGYGPIISVPASLTIGATTYNRGTHYDIVHRDDAFGYGPSSSFGLLWRAAGAIPVAGSAFTLSYTYNSTPATIQQLIESQWRLVGTDCMVHAGISTFYRIHLAVAYERNYDTTAVNTAINAALALLMNGLAFDSSLQVSDILQAVHNVPGVDNVRFLNSTDDGVHYAIEKISSTGVATGVLSQIGGRAVDLYFDDAHFPLFHSSRILVKTRTNFGTP